MVRKLLNRRDNEIAAVASVNGSLLRVFRIPSTRATWTVLSNRSDISFPDFSIKINIFKIENNFYRGFYAQPIFFFLLYLLLLEFF